MQTLDDGVTVEENVVFGTGGGRELRCDVYRPADPAGSAPAALVVHGGGWRRGSKEAVRDQALVLARHGFVAVANEYRLSGEARWPAHIHDMKAAIRWVRASAGTLGIDPTKIAAVGFSAGAHLSLLAAGTAGDSAFSGTGGSAEASEELNAAVGFYTPVRFHMPGQKLSGASPATALAEDLSAEEASTAGPYSHVSEHFPPTMLLHGTNDKVVPVSASLRMYEALSEHRVRSDLRIYSGLPHGFPRLPGMLDVSMNDVASFLDREMVAPDRYVISGTMPEPVGT